jgi:cell wall-associated NlpC family hydrolase
MKKSIIAAVAVLTLAGCSASVVVADQSHKEPVKAIEVKNVKPAETRKSLYQFVKPNRNLKHMKKIVKYLKTRVNRTSYVFSGSSPNGWDCSGMVRWTYKQFGLDIPHSANKQAHIGKRVSNPNVGDIVVMAYKGSTNFYHSGIYIGNGKIINAHYQADTTIIQPLTDYKRSQIRFVRVIEQEKMPKGLIP